MESQLPLLEMAAASYLGQGNVACYRGPRLYDANSSEVRAVHPRRSDALHITTPRPDRTPSDG